MFALKKVPKLHTITRILSDDEHSVSFCLISGCKHGRLKISSLPLTNVLRLSLLKFGLLLFSPTRHTIAHAHEYSYVCKCKNREQGYSTLSEGGFVWDLRKCVDHNHCVQWREWVMYRTIESRGEGMLHSAQFVLHYLKKTRKPSSLQCLMQESYGFLLLHSIYCMYQNIYKGGLSRVCSVLVFFHSGKFHNHTHYTRTHIPRLSINMYVCVWYKYTRLHR